MTTLERQLMAMRLRLSGLTWEQVGKQLPTHGYYTGHGVTRERARQIALKGYRALKHPSRRKLPEFALAVEWAKKFAPDDFPAKVAS